MFSTVHHAVRRNEVRRYYTAPQEQVRYGVRDRAPLRPRVSTLVQCPAQLMGEIINDLMILKRN